MILGKQTSAVPRADCYYVELEFVDGVDQCSYDTAFFTKDHFLAILRYVLEMPEDWDVDESHDIYTHFVYNFIHPDHSTATIVRIAYVDSDAVFHHFELSKEYIETNHPELLL